MLKVCNCLLSSAIRTSMRNSDRRNKSFISSRQYHMASTFADCTVFCWLAALRQLITEFCMASSSATMVRFPVLAGISRTCSIRLIKLWSAWSSQKKLLEVPGVCATFDRFGEDLTKSQPQHASKKSKSLLGVVASSKSLTQ